MTAPRVAVIAAGLAAGLAVAGTGCSGGSGGSGGNAKDPKALLAQAKATLDAASAVHVRLTASGAPAGGLTVQGAEGDVVRPDGFQGTLTVSVGGGSIMVPVVSKGGKVAAQLPGASALTPIDPATYGVGDPGRLLDPSAGVSSLLTAVSDAKTAGRDRLAGEVLREVDVTLPGQTVKDVLLDADPSVAVTGRVGITDSGSQVRHVVLRGPFFAKGTTSTLDVVLSGYGESVTVSAPPG